MTIELVYILFLCISTTLSVPGMSILQWNARGLIGKWAECKPFLLANSPISICVQETHFLDTDRYNFTIPGYSLYTKNVDSDYRQGGVAIYILNTIPHYEVQIQSTLQAVACHVNINNHRFMICSVYLPPNKHITEADLNDLVRQLDGDYIICTDANAKHTLWGSPSIDRRGRVVFDFVYNNALHTLNDGSGTRQDTYTGHLSHLDLSICTLNLVPYLDWKVHADNRCSDHFPISIFFAFRVFSQQTILPRRTKWSVKRANWQAFNKDCKLITRVPNELTNANDMCERLSQGILDSAEQHVPLVRGKAKHRNMWWNDDCRRAVARRKRALMKYKRCICQTHLIELQRERADTQ